MRQVLIDNGILLKCTYDAANLGFKERYFLQGGSNLRFYCLKDRESSLVAEYEEITQ